MSDVATPTAAQVCDLDARLDNATSAATRALLDRQRSDGHWVFELEADCTIPAEYVLLTHYRGEEVDTKLERKIAVYLRRIQSPKHGGWPLFHDGKFDMSASVKAYFALKMIGDDIDAPHMKRAREAILSRGGAINSNVFTRILLSLFGILRWQSVPVMPVEIMLLPEWFPFHITKISYWGRTVVVPLLVLMTLKPRAKNPRGVTIDELFLQPPLTIGPPHKAPHQKWIWFSAFRLIDIVLRPAVKLSPKGLRQRAINRAVEFVSERLNGEDGLGAIFPAMANACLMFDVLGDAEQAKIARASLDKLLGDQGRRGLLPALRLAGVGHRARLSHAARRGQRGGQAPGAARARMACALAGARRRRRLDRAAAGPAPRRLGLPIRQRALSRPRRHRGGGDGHGPGPPHGRRGR